MKKLFELIIYCLILCVFSSCKKEETSSTTLVLELQKENTIINYIAIDNDYGYSIGSNFYKKGINITNPEFFTFTNIIDPFNDTIIYIYIDSTRGTFRNRFRINPGRLNYIIIKGSSLNFYYGPDEEFNNKFNK